MGVVVPHKAIEAISRSRDPRSAILDFMGDISDVEVLLNRVLVATHIRSNVTTGGIIRPDVNVEEDVWQGKCGLILKYGPDAFKDDEEYTWGASKLYEGDWGVYKVGDGWSVTVKNYPCRIVRDSSFMMRVQDPNVIL
jgi:co-chaperonin GroES (HSP10)